MPTEARETVEEAARESRARLLAILSRRTKDLAAAEDALQLACLKALERWPETGPPRHPEAWLLTAAKHALIDSARRSVVAGAAEQELLRAIDELAEEAGSDSLPERRLELLLVCSHPAIDEAVRPALMLNVVLGVTAAEMAPCWLVSAEAMAQRLVRAKAKIKTAGIPFGAPPAEEREERIGAVLEAIYAALTLGDGVAEEAAYLAALVSRLMPNHAEAAGLRALSLQILGVRHGEGELFVPLSKRNTGEWNSDALDLADAILTRTAQRGTPGRFQLEAAITSAHIASAREGKDTQAAVLHLYRQLLAIAPTVGARCGYAAALVDAGELDAAALVLRELAPLAENYGPYWASLGALQQASGQGERAREAWSRASALMSDPRQKAYLRALSEEGPTS